MKSIAKKVTSIADWISPADVRRELKIPAQFEFYLRKAGKLPPCVALGNREYYLREEYERSEAFLRARKVRNSRK